MKIQSFKDLIVWKKSIHLVKAIYLVTSELPVDEKFSLINQMRRAAVSIPSNISEGYKRKNTAEYIQFLCIADASAAELETQLIIAKDIYAGLDYSKAEKLLTEVQKMLITMIKKLRKPPKP